MWLKREVVFTQGCSALSQVWSLTPNIFFRFSTFNDRCKECIVSVKHMVKGGIILFERCHGTYAPSALHLMVFLFRCSSGSNLKGNLGGPSRVMCELKNPFKVPGPSHGSCWREQNCLSLWGPDALICRIYNFFYKDQKEKNWGLVAWPVSALGWLCIRRIPLDEIGVVRPPEKKVVNHGVCALTQLATMAKMQAIEAATLQHQI